MLLKSATGQLKLATGPQLVTDYIQLELVVSYLLNMPLPVPTHIVIKKKFIFSYKDLDIQIHIFPLLLST